MSSKPAPPGGAVIWAGTDEKTHRVSDEVLVSAFEDDQEVHLDIQNSLDKVSGKPGLRHGGVRLGYDVATLAFEEALKNGLKLNPKETRRLLKAIIKASTAF